MTYQLGKKYVDGGVWFDCPLGARFLLARTERNAEFLRVKRELEREAKARPGALLADGEFDPEVQSDIASECYARAVLLDWDGVVDEDKHPIPYTWQLGKQLLLDDERVARWVAQTALDESRFRVEERDVTVKKSSRRSAGAKPTAATKRSSRG